MKKISLLLLGLFIMLNLVACNANKDEATTEAVEPVVDRQMEIYGKVSLGDKTQVNFSKGLKVIEVYVKSGQKIEKNTPLFKVDLDDLKAQAEVLQKQMVATKQQLSLGNPTYGKANLAVRQLRNRLVNAQKLYQDNLVLYKEGAISESALKESKNAITELNNSIKQAQYDLKNASNTDNQTDTLKQVELMQQETQLDAINKVLNSPMIEDGVVKCLINKALIVDVVIQDGSFLSAYQPALTLANASEVIIKANVAEEQLKEIELDKKVKIKPLFDRTLEIDGKISFISAQARIANNETVIPIEITCDKTDLLLPNLNVDVIIPLDNAE